MAANMQQHMGGPGQMMGQQVPKSVAQGQLQQYIYHALKNSPPPISGTWQNSITVQERHVMTMQLATQIQLSQANPNSSVSTLQIAEFAARFERETFQSAGSKEAYFQAFSGKLSDFHKRRQANEPNLQNQLNSSAQAQAQAQNAQAQAMMNMQAQQMGRGMSQQNFAQMQRPMQQMPGMPPQQQPQFRPQQPPQQPGQQPQQFTQQQMLAAQRQMQQQAAQQQQQQQHLGMPNQAGRGMGPGPGPGPNPQQMMAAMAAGPNRQPDVIAEIAKLNPVDRAKVMDVAAKMMQGSSEESRNQMRAVIHNRFTQAQIQEMQSQGRDPMHMLCQQQAFNMLRNNAAARMKQQQSAQGQQTPQPPMMQQQHSQQSFQQLQQQQQQQAQQQAQQRQKMMNAAQQGPGAGPNDFNQFPPNMESIKDQQMNGIMAQQAGHMVVPISNTAPGPQATSQPMAQTMSNQQSQNQNQTPRLTPQQQQMKMQQQQQTPQPPQAQMQAPGQMNQAAMGGPMGGPSQSPAMGTLNTPVSHPANAMNQMPGQPGQPGPQGNPAFGINPQTGARFNQQQVYNAFIAAMTPDQRAKIAEMPPAQLNELLKRFHHNQMANRPGGPGGPGGPNGQMNPASMGPQGMQPHQQPPQQPQPATVSAGAMMANRIPPQQAAAMMDAMDVPPTLLERVSQLHPSLPPGPRKWGSLKMWAKQNAAAVGTALQNQLSITQNKQFHNMLGRRLQQTQQMPQQQGGQPQPGQQQPGQPPQNMGMNGGPMATPGGGPMPPNMQRPPMGPQAGIPNFNVTAEEMQGLRNSKPAFAALPDEQLRQAILNMKRNAWQNNRAQHMQRMQQQQQMQMQQMQNQQAQAQAQAHAQAQAQTQVQAPQQQGQQHQQPGGVPMGQPPQHQQTPQQTPMQQPHVTPQQQAQARMTPASMGQPGTTPQQQKAPTSDQKSKAGPAARGGKKATPSPAQGTKNLKRPSSDSMADTVNGANAMARSASQQQGQQQGQQQRRGSQQPFPVPPSLSAEDIANMTPEYRAKYEQMRAVNAAQQQQQGQQGQQGQQQTQAQAAECLARLKVISQEEMRRANQESMPDLPLSAAELQDMPQKLIRFGQDIQKVGRGLAKWYSMTKDDDRSRQFFRARLRMVRQFTDGEHMQHPKDTFSVSPAEVDQARNMLQSMVMDIAAKFRAQNGQGQAPANQAQEQLAQQQRLLAQRQEEQLAAQTQAMQAQQQLVQNQQQAQQGQPGPVPLSAANLEKNSQALKNQTQKAAKAPKAPMAPTTANPPFPFGASSPHGNPSYVGKTKEMNLQIPPRKKARLDKQGGSGSQTATPSPQQGTAKVPEPQQEPQQPPAPVLVCKDPECQSSVAGYATEEALQQHVEEEHVKPKANPLRFCLDNLAAALGLGPGGTAKKEQGPSQAQQLKATGPAMSRTASKQAQTPGNLGVQTPRSLDGGVGMTWSASSQGHNAKAGAVKTAASTSGSPDPWASSSLDAQELVNKLGFPNGISSVALDPAVLRSLTPKDTPESSKDGGPSEPNTEAAGDAASGDPGLGDSWYTLDDMDMDMVFDIDQAAAGGEAADPSLNKVSMDPSLLTDAGGLEPDWDDLGLDLQGPFTVDASQLSMGYS